MVLLHQHSFRRHHWPLHHHFLQGLEASSQDRTRNMEQGQAHGPDWDHDVHSRNHLHPLVTPMGRNQVRLGQCADHRALRSLRRLRLVMVCRPVLETRRGHRPAAPAQESQCTWRRDSRHVPGRLILRVWLLCKYPHSRRLLTSTDPPPPSSRSGSKLSKKSPLQNQESTISPWSSQ